MTKEQKDLLLKDLCARLPYGVKCKYHYIQFIGIGEIININRVGIMNIDGHIKDVCDIKPYLFPLSSMTEEQKKEISKKYNYYNPYQLCVEITNHREGYWDNDNSCDLQDYLWLEDWFNKNHFDYRGLIPMGLANDATGLNIY